MNSTLASSNGSLGASAALALVVACFTLSGFAALLYQTAWMRLFAIAFGTSELSVVIVLAGYMAGLAIGALAIAPFVDRLRRPVLVYGLLEGAIAAAALAMPALVDWTGELYALIAGGQPAPPDAWQMGQTLFYAVASIIVLLIPTGLMGATLPLLARYAVTSNENLGGRIALLYAVNTFGAVGGTLAAGFMLLPALGLRGTVWVGVAVNALVFGVAVWLARSAPAAPIASDQSPAAPSPRGFRLVLLLIALSGVLSFTYEVLWTRMLSHVLGSSTYAFATMLAAFLTGIALGAACAARFAKDRRWALMLFGWCQFGVALASALVYWRLEQWTPSTEGLVLAAFAVMLPSTIFIGATYPFAVRAYARQAADAGRASAVVYSWNTFGTIAGALLAGFLIVPWLGFAGTARLAVAANLAIGLIALASLVWGAESELQAKPGQRRRGFAPSPAQALGGGAVLAVATLVLFQPARPDALVTRPIFGGSGEPVLRELYYAVGRSSTVYLTENSLRFDFMSNGLPEAQIEFKGGSPRLLSQRWLGLWPSLARPDLESMLIIGLGGGVVVEGTPPTVRNIHVVELETEVVRANETVGARRTVDPLADGRTIVTVNDARNALRLTSARYGAIVSQPSHPWTAGASHLFTREFVALAKSRLKENGVLVQWMDAGLIDERLLRKLAATLVGQFDNVRLYQSSALRLHFLASDGPLDLGEQLANTGRPLSDAPEHYHFNLLYGPADLAAALLLDEAGVASLAAAYAPVTDDRNSMATDSRMLADGLHEAALLSITASRDPLLNPASWLRRSLDDRELAYVGIRLAGTEQTVRLTLLLETIARPSTRELLTGVLARIQGRHEEAKEALAGIAPEEPVWELALFLQALHRLAISGPRAFADQEAASQVSDSLGAVFEGWRALSRRDWDALRALEPRLASARASDLWAPDAGRLRAEWRWRAEDPTGTLAREALGFADRYAAHRASPEACALRANIAVKLGDAAALTETLADMVAYTQHWISALPQGVMSLRAPEQRWLRSQLAYFTDELDKVASAPGEDSRSAFVLAELQALQESLDLG